MSTSSLISYDLLPAWALIALMLLGIFLLWLGGDKLTDGAGAVGLHLNIDPIIIGLTIVSVATSLPELVTSLIASVMGSSDVAVGNIVGSNIANIGLILGLGALIWPFTRHINLLRHEMPILLAVSLVFALMGYTGGVLDRVEGFVLLIITASYIAFIVRRHRRSQQVGEDEEPLARELPKMSIYAALAWVLLGGALLAVGSDVLVNASIVGARHLGISELVIGLTIVAVGTSLPELAATIASSLKGQSDIVAGNIVGSNLFNMMLIGGSVSAIAPVDFAQRLFRLEIPAMFGLTALLWFMMRRSERVGRVEGAVLLLTYAAVTLMVVRAGA